MIAPQEGRCYRLGDGRVTASLVNTGNRHYPFEDLLSGLCWTAEGRYFTEDVCSEPCPLDLKEEVL